jgi:recombination protein RecA
MTISPDKAKAVDSAMGQIERQFGKGAIMKLGARPIENIPVISTGSIELDRALGIGGLPRGRVIEIFGPESSGKTTLALHAVAHAQKQGGIAAFIDAEHALDTGYARKLGVNCDELLVSQPDTGEQALEIADMLVRSGAIDVMVIDSVAALVPRAEIEGEMGDSHMGLQARLMSQALRKLTGTIGKDHDLGDFHQPDPHEDRRGVRQPGDHHRRQRPQILRLRESGHPAHRRHQGRPGGGGQPHPGQGGEKQDGPAVQEAEFDIMYGEGISRAGDLLDVGVNAGIIDKSGSWYSYDGERIGQGRENVKKFFQDNSDLFESVDLKVREAVGLLKKPLKHRRRKRKLKKNQTRNSRCPTKPDTLARVPRLSL